MAETQAKTSQRSCLLDKYRGCLMGVLLGDCIGALFEKPEGFLPYVNVTEIEAAIESHLMNPEPSLSYTDDTAMTLSMAESLLKNGGLNPQNLAVEFVQRFRKEISKQNLYAKVRWEVFEKWEAVNFTGDIFGPAKMRFHGAGSNGNGGAMRIAAVALFCGKDLDGMIEMAKISTQLTHSHPEGYNGAILQAYAIHLALFNKKLFDREEFLENLLNFCATRLENSTTEKPFMGRLRTVQELLSQEKIPSSEVISKLGHSVRALDAVPMAIFCALRFLKQIPEIQNENPFERTVIFAISMGGDTDTIASMAAAITGALLGVNRISSPWIKMCEASHKLLTMADALYVQNI